MRRIAYLDAVKLVTIFLVVYGHVIQMMVDGRIIGAHIWKPIYSFHMPLFMLISGYFLSSRVLAMPFGSMLKAKCKQLLLPALTCTIICCLYLFLVREKVNLRDEFIGNSWFLKTLFIYYVLFWLLKRTRLNDWLLFFMSCVFLFIVPRGSTLQVNLLWPYFFMGFFLKKYRILDMLKERWYVAVIFALMYIGTYFAQLHFDIPNYVPINIETLQHQWHYILLRYTVAFSGSMFVISFVSLIYKRWKNVNILNKLASFGKYTLGVYVLQSIFVVNIFPDTFAWRVESRWMFDLLITPSLAIAFLTLCLLLILLLSRNKVLDLLFFGGQYYNR
ncbi:MAG: acyltransferase family protein [Muribaculaceae bacterium]|nr:acyltransferase family protein [Muribaculaceae bacterium]